MIVIPYEQPVTTVSATLSKSGKLELCKTL